MAHRELAHADAGDVGVEVSMCTTWFVDVCAHLGATWVFTSVCVNAVCVCVCVCRPVLVRDERLIHPPVCGLLDV